MRYIVAAVVGISMLCVWLAGLAIAQGFWQTLGAIFPFYAWYLVIEKLMIAYGFIP